MAAASAAPDWRHRRGAATFLAEAIEAQAAIVSDDLLRQSGCEGDLETLHRAIEALRAHLVEAERLSLHFDCADRHAAEQP